MKSYVQHRLLEQKRKLLQWLEKGAIIYVCGDASHMEKEVKATLIKSFQEELNFTEQEAIAYFKQLKQNNRYLTDVY